MLRIADLQNSLRHIVGWRQDMNPTKYISEDLTTSESGLYFQDANPLLTLDNIRAIRRNTPTSDFPTWNAYDTFTAGTIVFMPSESFSEVEYNDSYANRNGRLYKALLTGANHNPTTDTQYWTPFSEFDNYLSQQVDIAIANVANTFVSNKTDGLASKSLIEHKCISEGAGRLANIIEPSSRLVGFEIEPVRGMGITTIINRLGLQMVGTSGTVKFYLFHSSQSAPIKTFTLEVSTNSTYKWFTVADLTLPYISDNNNSGGQWYLCYYESELPYGMKAVNLNRDWAADPCPQCSRINVDVWRSLTKYVRLSPFAATVSSTFTTTPTLPDVTAIEYTPTKCYGINMELSVHCDLTDFIITQRYEFAKCIQLQLAINVLRAIAYNPDVTVSRNQQNVARQDVILEIDGNTYTRSGGLLGDLNKQYKTLDIDTSNLDSVCLACRKSGIKIRNI